MSIEKEFLVGGNFTRYDKIRTFILSIPDEIFIKKCFKDTQLSDLDTLLDTGFITD